MSYETISSITSEGISTEAVEASLQELATSTEKLISINGTFRTKVADMAYEHELESTPVGDLINDCCNRLGELGVTFSDSLASSTETLEAGIKAFGDNKDQASRFGNIAADYIGYHTDSVFGYVNQSKELRNDLSKSLEGFLNDATVNLKLKKTVEFLKEEIDRLNTQDYSNNGSFHSNMGVCMSNYKLLRDASEKLIAEFINQ